MQIYSCSMKLSVFIPIIINQLFFLFMAFIFEYVERTSSFLLISSSILLEKSHYYSFSLTFFILSKYFTKHKLKPKGNIPLKD